jgi:hypothetical protein
MLRGPALRIEGNTLRALFPFRTFKLAKKSLLMGLGFHFTVFCNPEVVARAPVQFAAGIAPPGGWAVVVTKTLRYPGVRLR